MNQKGKSNILLKAEKDLRGGGVSKGAEKEGLTKRDRVGGRLGKRNYRSYEGKNDRLQRLGECRLKGKEDRKTDWVQRKGNR